MVKMQLFRWDAVLTAENAAFHWIAGLSTKKKCKDLDEMGSVHIRVFVVDNTLYPWVQIVNASVHVLINRMQTLLNKESAQLHVNPNSKNWLHRHSQE